MWRQPKAKAFAKNVLLNQERKLEDRRRSDTALVLTINYVDQYPVLRIARSVQGTLRETRVSGFLGEYGCKAET